MNPDFFLAIGLFCFASCATPGPNNLLLLASGVNFGFRRTVPHMLGINFGFALMVLLVGLGLVQLFARFPPLHTAMKWGSVVFMLYLAWKIATAAAPKTSGDAQAKRKPMRWWQAALFQWVNPKGWAMGVSAIATHVPLLGSKPSMPHLLALALMYFVVNVPVSIGWTLFGVRLRSWLANDTHRRWFNHGMASVLVLSLLPMLL
jgi:threonine/homoserine/homoserine lactone efflux protein